MLASKRSSYRIHFVGIGGIGMSGIAEVLLTLGYRVSGSDLKESPTTQRLASLGAEISIGHRAEQVGGVDVVVVSSAVRPSNPEVIAAHQRGIPVIARALMLGELMRMKHGVAVAGSHGKTTTTSMIAHVLAHAGLDPTCVIGGVVNSLGTNARLGQGEVLVAEADESDGSFLHLSPTIAVVTNIDREHIDHYHDESVLRQSFLEFINKVPFYGLAVLCHDHPVVSGLFGEVRKRYVTYGLEAGAVYQGRDLRFGGLEVSFELCRRGISHGRIRLCMTGAHNVLNALATIAVADELGVPSAVAGEALSAFHGVSRRFTIKGEVDDILVVDDYGHHPAEIAATVAGARKAFPGRRLVVAFQPHRYTRTHDLFDEFVDVLRELRPLVVTEVYAAGEDPIAGADGARLAEAAGARFVAKRTDLADALLDELLPGDLCITLGAGDITLVGDELLDKLKRRQQAAQAGRPREGAA